MYLLIKVHLNRSHPPLNPYGDTRKRKGNIPLDGVYCLFLSTYTEFLDDCPIPLDILLLEVVEESPSLADDLQKTAPAVVVLFVNLEVLRQIDDPLGENRDLNLRRPRIAVVTLERCNDLLLLVRYQHSRTPPFIFMCSDL